MVRGKRTFHPERKPEQITNKHGLEFYRHRGQPYDGDDLDGITLYTLTGFLKQIEEDCAPDEAEATNE